ncbi:hypothetical protein [Streptomyces sp. P9-A2]|uniref:hypothetical protein n=1 Tax=Streptomyces sp. P9-A2 TaxID=3072284 RepID=UPI002FC8E249
MTDRTSLTVQSPDPYGQDDLPSARPHSPLRSFLIPLRIELARSGFLWFVPVLVCVGVAIAWHTLRPGVAYWPSTITSANASVVITGPLVAGMATWLGAREKRRGLVYLRVLSPQADWLHLAAELIAVLAWTAFSYVFVLLTVALRTSFMGATGRFSLSAALAGAMGLCLHAVAGYAIGRCWHGRIAPPLVAIGAFVITLYGSGGYGSSWYLLFPVLIDVPDPFSAWQPGLYWRQLLWLFALVALLTSLCLAGVWRSRILLACVAFSAALAVAGGYVTWQLRGVYFEPGEPAFSYACRQGTVTVCVNPTFRAALPDLEAGFSEIVRKLDGTPGEVTKLEQRPRGVGGAASPGAHAIHMDNLGPGWLSEVRSEFLQELVDQDACMDAEEDAYLLTESVAAWITDEAVPENSRSAYASDHLRGLSPGQSRNWLNDHFTQFRECSLVSSDFTRS